MTRRRILLPLLLAALFCACAPSRRTAAVHSRAENDLRMQVLREELSTRDSLFFRALCEELIRNLDGERHLHRVVGEEVETVTREYDTSRPVDTLTGTPPLRRETTQRRRLTDSTHEDADCALFRILTGIYFNICNLCKQLVKIFDF